VARRTFTITSPPLDFDAQDAGSNPEQGPRPTGSRSRMQSALLALQEAVDGHPQGALAPMQFI
jgi:hypothetical protein